MHTKDDIARLLSRTTFLTGEESQSILRRAQHASPEALEILSGLLNDALTKQDDYLRRMVAADPAFPKKLDQFLRGTVHRIAQEHEFQAQKDAPHLFDRVT